MARKLFGTDGVRGVANIEPMTPETVLALGQAAAVAFRREGRRNRILIGKDTRLSGYMLETALASGICSMGTDVLLVGPLPTPGIAFLTASMRSEAGVVISASHNPYQDNGIKFFDQDGFKLPDEQEERIERLMEDQDHLHGRCSAAAVGRAWRLDDAVGRYLVFLKNTLPRGMTLDGMRIVLDCANGAAYRVAPQVLDELGAEVIEIGTTPDGININDGVGALHPEVLCEQVRRSGAQLGIALDGDADRLILADENGAVVDGDHVMAMMARQMAADGALRQNTLVATVMSNIGLELACREMGCRLLRAPVGDRYVMEELRRGGYNFGGEQSGHLIFLDHATAGDGTLAALQVLSLMVRSAKPLSELARVMTGFPQVLRNLTVRQKPDISGLPGVCAALRAGELELGERGRVLVRYSGTEMQARVMIEGEDQRQIERLCDAILAELDKAIGLG